MFPMGCSQFPRSETTPALNPEVPGTDMERSLSALFLDPGAKRRRVGGACASLREGDGVSCVHVGAVRGAERAGALRHPLGLLVPDHGGGRRRGGGAAGDPRTGSGVQPEKQIPGAGRGGEGGAEGREGGAFGQLQISLPTYLPTSTYTALASFLPPPAPGGRAWTYKL